MKKALAIVLALAMALTLVACGGTPTSSSAPASASTPASGSASAAGSDVKSVEGMTVTFIPKVTGNAFFEVANDGAQKYAEDWGITVDYQGSAIGTALASLIIGLMRIGMPLCFKVNTQYLDIPIGILLIVVVVGRAAANHPKTAALFAKLKRQKERPAVKTAK